MVYRHTPLASAMRGYTAGGSRASIGPIDDSKLMQETNNGEIITELSAGQSYAREIGVEHNVVNPNPHEFVFVEVELK